MTQTFDLESELPLNELSQHIEFAEYLQKQPSVSLSRLDKKSKISPSQNQKNDSVTIDRRITLTLRVMLCTVIYIIHGSLVMQGVV